MLTQEKRSLARPWIGLVVLTVLALAYIALNNQLGLYDESGQMAIHPDMVIQEVELDPTDIYMYVLPNGSQVVSVCLNGTRAFVVHDMQDDPSGIAVQEAQSC